jgi:PAS domain S-box-containing protein
MQELSPFHSWSAASPYAIALGLTALLCLVVLARAWRLKAQPGGSHLMLMTGAAGIWALLYCFELATSALDAKVFWAKFEYLGICLVPVAWFLFARAYSGARKRLDRSVILLLSLVPALTLFLVVSNDFHHLVWSQVSLATSSQFPNLVLGHGPWYWVNIIYAYSLLAMGDYLLLRNAFRQPTPYRRGVFVIVAASLAPWAGNGLFLFWPAWSGRLDVTPFAFALTVLAMLIVTSKWRGFNLFPELLRAARIQVLEKMADAVIVLDLCGRVVTSNPAADRLFSARVPNLVGVHITEILGDKAPTEAQHFVKEDLQFEIALGVGGPERHFHVVSSALGLGAGHGMGRLLVLRDITERRQAEEAAMLASESLQARVEDLNTLLRIAETVAGPVDLHAALMIAAEEIEHALSARGAAIVTFQGDEKPKIEVSLDETGAFIPEDILIQNVHGYFEALAELPEGSGPVIINDLVSDISPVSLLQQAEIMKLSHLLVVPLIVQAKAIGGLVVVRRAGAPRFSDGEVGFVQSAASTVAGAIIHAQLREEETQRTASQVREHLARELHDAVTQSVYSANLMAQALPSVLARDPDEGQAGIRQLQRLVRSALAELRILLYELRPATIAGVGFDQLLEKLGDSIAGQANVNVTIEAQLEFEVPQDVKMALYRIAQEAFNNINKHARAERVWASILSEADGITLDIADDGVGVDLEAIEGDHMGLGIMEERAEEIDAEFGIFPAEPRGTQVLVHWKRPKVARRRNDSTGKARRPKETVKG